MGIVTRQKFDCWPWCLVWRCLSAVTLSLLIISMGLAANKSWNAGDGSWYTASNWTPHGVPVGDEDIRIGNLPGVQNSTVMLAAPGSGYDFLEISNGMTLDMNGGELVSFDDAFITGLNSRLIVRPAPGPNMQDFQGVLHVGEGAHFEMRDNAPVRIFEGSESAGVVSGRGEIIISGTIPFSNSGTIDPDPNGGITITQGESNRFPINLDSLFGAGHLKLDTPFSELTINASELTDSFSGTVSMAPGALLTMNLEQSWRADFFSNINIGGLDNPAAASQIAGSDLELDGGINVGGAQGHLRVLANAIVKSHADANVGVGDWLEFDGATTVDGGQFSLGEDAQLDFNGATLVRGGEFTTFSSLSSDGAVDFNGQTDWDGVVTINGIARQVGDAGVIGPTTINAAVLDMDGNGGSHWNINSVAIINATHIDSSISDTFDGTIDVGSGFVPRLTINLDDSSAHWTMAGEMNLAGVPGAVFFTDRLAGSHMRLTGNLHLNRLAGISADVTLANGSTVNFENAATALRMNGITHVEPAAEFFGPGSLRNGPMGHMILESGVSLSQVGMINEGLLEVGDLAGIATVDRFENLADGVWSVELGGYVAGSEFDLLVVGTGSALLDGILAVELIDGGSGLFLPTVGDEFTILTALGGVTGEFINEPVSVAAGKAFHWSVVYNPNDVTLRLTDITVPEPSTWGLAILGILTLMSRRSGLPDASSDVVIRLLEWG